MPKFPESEDLGPTETTKPPQGGFVVSGLDPRRDIRTNANYRSRYDRLPAPARALRPFALANESGPENA